MGKVIWERNKRNKRNKRRKEKGGRRYQTTYLLEIASDTDQCGDQRKEEGNV